MERKIKLRYKPTGEITINKMSAILELINLDHSDDWIDYNEKDWLEGWLEWCESDDYCHSIFAADGSHLNNYTADDLDIFKARWANIEQDRGNVVLKINEFNESAEVKNNYSISLKKESIQDIIDHAIQLALIIRHDQNNNNLNLTGDVDGICAELENALSSSNVKLNADVL